MTLPLPAVPGSPEPAIDDALGQAAAVAPPGDVGALTGAIPASDPFTNLRQDDWQRINGIASLAGPAGAVTAWRASQGQHVLNWAKDSYPPVPPARHATMVPVAGREVPVGPDTATLAAAHQPLPGQKEFWETSSDRFLSTDPRQADTGWAHLAAQVSPNVEHANTVVYDIGHRLVAESLPHATNEPLDAARWGLTHFQAAVEQGVLKGETAKMAGRAWDALQAGAELNLEQQKHLSDAIVRLEGSLGWVDHPELKLSDSLTLKSIDLDGVDAAVDFGYTPGGDYELALSGPEAIDADGDIMIWGEKAELAKSVEGSTDEATIRVDPQGNMAVLAAQPLAVRGRWATNARVDGMLVMAPTQRAPVEDAVKQHAGSGRLYRNGTAPDTWLQPGDHMIINAPAPQAGAHDGLLAELRSVGVHVELAKHAPHLSNTDKKVAATYTFESKEDLEAAHRYLYTRQSDEMTPAQRLFNEEALDQAYYTDRPPAGTTPVTESHLVDLHGNVLITDGEGMSNRVTAHVMRAPEAKIEPTLEFIQPDPFVEPEAAMLGGQLRIDSPGKALGPGRGVLPTVDGKAQDTWHLYMTPVPMLSTEKIDESTFPLRNVNGRWKLDANDKNPIAASQALDALRRVGIKADFS